MRPFMQKRIDALHAEIARLVGVEKAWSRKQHPGDRFSLFHQIEDAKIEVSAWSPRQRENAGIIKEKTNG